MDKESNEEVTYAGESNRRRSGKSISLNILAAAARSSSSSSMEASNALLWRCVAVTPIGQASVGVCLLLMNLIFKRGMVMLSFGVVVGVEITRSGEAGAGVEATRSGKGGAGVETTRAGKAEAGVSLMIGAMNGYARLLDGLRWPRRCRKIFSP